MVRARLAIAAAVIGFVVPHAVLVAAAEGAEDKETPLTKAAAAGELETVRTLIAKGADVQARNKKGDTPLHVACEKGHLAVARYLVEHGAPVDGKGYFEKTPLHVAAGEGHVEVAEFLIAKGAKLESKHQNEMTPLMSAAWGGRTKCVELLVAKKADTRAASGPKQLTALHFAVMLAHKDVAVVLIDKGKTPVDITSRFGSTPLHFAAEGRYIPDSIAEMLIAKGADVNARNEGGLTPLKFARGRDKDALVKTLLKHGAKE